MTTTLYAQRRARVATAIGRDGIAIIPTAPNTRATATATFCTGTTATSIT
jgi:hypothetical protein